MQRLHFATTWHSTEAFAPPRERWLQILQESGQEFKIIDYLKKGVSFDELKSIIDLLAITPIKLIRKNEAIWKEHYKGKELSNDEIIFSMIEHLKLIERPIVINKESWELLHESLS